MELGRIRPTLDDRPPLDGGGTNDDPSSWSLARRAAACDTFGEFERQSSAGESASLLMGSMKDLMDADDDRHDRSAVIAVVLTASPVAGRALIFLGGYAVFQSARAQRVYNGLFLASYLVCFALCLANCLPTFRTAPFVELKLDVATVYVHVPAFHAYLFWKRFVVADATNASAPVSMLTSR